MRSIVAAAIKVDGLTISVDAPLRHHHIYLWLEAAGFPTPTGGVQGFLTNDGLFVDRKIGMELAIEAKQLISRRGQHGVGGYLFSEDLW